MLEVEYKFSSCRVQLYHALVQIDEHGVFRDQRNVLGAMPFQIRDVLTAVRNDRAIGAEGSEPAAF